MRIRPPKTSTERDNVVQPSIDTMTDDSMAAAYERYLVPAVFEPFARDLLPLLEPPPSLLLDVGCGTGVVARVATREFAAFSSASAVAVDSNLSMLSVGRARTHDQLPLRFVHARAEKLPFDDELFDAVVCQQGLQFFADRKAALLEMRRVMVDRGRLVISLWCRPELLVGLAALATALADEVGPELGHLLASGPACLGDVDEVVDDVRAAGFPEPSVNKQCRTVCFSTTADFVEQYIASTPLQRMAVTWEPERYARVLDHVGRALQPYCVSGRLEFPMVTHVLATRR